MPLYEKRQNAMQQRQQYAATAAMSARQNAIAGAAQASMNPTSMLTNQRMLQEAQGHTKAHFEARNAIADREAAAMRDYNDQLYRWAQMALDETNSTFDQQMREREMALTEQTYEDNTEMAGKEFGLKEESLKMQKNMNRMNFAQGRRQNNLMQDRNEKDYTASIVNSGAFDPASVKNAMNSRGQIANPRALRAAEKEFTPIDYRDNPGDIATIIGASNEDIFDEEGNITVQGDRMLGAYQTMFNNSPTFRNATPEQKRILYQQRQRKLMGPGAGAAQGQGQGQGNYQKGSGFAQNPSNQRTYEALQKMINDGVELNDQQRQFIADYEGSM